MNVEQNACECIVLNPVLNSELEEQMNVMDDKLDPISVKHLKTYECEMCKYITYRKYNYDKHVLSKKHVMKLLGTKPPVTTQEPITCICGKKYKDPSGLWKHAKRCATHLAHPTEQTTSTPQIQTRDTTIVTQQHTHGLPACQSYPETSNCTPSVLQHNSELTSVIIDLLKQNQDIQKQLLELAKEGKTITHNNTNTTTNNSFNLNVYLNETCKDAINMVDFVNSLHLQLSDLEETGKLGYSNGMSRIFINGLKDMDVCKRPIHCSDLKRETLYIKEDNVWEKDTDSRDKIKKAIRKIEQKNIQQIPLWIKAHPNCVHSSNRESTSYLKMVMHSTGGSHPDEEMNMGKIISNIAKEVVISK